MGEMVRRPGELMAESAHLYALGLKACQAGEIRKGVEYFTQAIAAQPNVAEYHNHLGQALVELGQFDEAIEHCKQALSLSPNLADAHVNIGDALRALGKPH